MAENKFFQSPIDKLIEESKGYQLPRLQTEQPAERPAQDSAAPVGAASRGGSMLPPDTLRPMFEDASAEYGIPLNVLASLAQQESSYRTDAVGVQTKWGRAKGVMQYLDSTAQGLGINPFDPRQAISAAARQMRERLDKGYTLDEAIMAHHGGDNRKQWGPKTQQYVRDVMGKAGKIGQGFIGAPEYDRDAMQAELDQQEPGRYKVVMPGEEPPSPLRADVQREMLRTGATPQEAGKALEAATTPETATLGTSTPSTSTPTTEDDYQGFVEATGAALSNVPERMQQSVAGMVQMFGEDMAQFRREHFTRQASRLGVTPEDYRLLYVAGNSGVVDQIRQSGVLPETATTAELLDHVKQNFFATLSPEQAEQFQKAGVINPDDLTAYANKWREDTKKTMKDVRPKPGSFAYYGSAAIGSLAEMVPMIAGAVITRNPSVAMGIMGGQVGGQAYAEGREKGLSEDDAQNYALLTAGAEAIPEALVVGRLLKPGAGILKKVLEGSVLEGAQEAVTAALQAAIDKGYVEPNMTLKEALVRIRDGAIVGTMIGGGMGGTIATIDKATGVNDPAKQFARELNRSIDNTEFTGTEAEAIAALDPNRQGTTPEAAPTATTPATDAATTPPAMVPDQLEEPAPVEPPKGALSRSAERATQRVNEPVNVVAPDGEVAGVLESYVDHGNGQWSARVQAEDGNTYDFTHEDGVSIVRQPVVEAEPVIEQAIEPVVEPIAEPVITDEVAVQPEAVAPVEPVTEPVVEQAAKPLSQMTEPELRSELKTIAQERKNLDAGRGSRDEVAAAINDIANRRKEVERAINALGQPKREEAATQAPMIIREKETGKPVMETSQPSVVEKINTEKYEAVTPQQHLGELNAAIRAGEAPAWALSEGATPESAMGQYDPPSVGQEVVLGKGRHAGTVTEVTPEHVKIRLGSRTEKMTLDTFSRRMGQAAMTDADTAPASPDQSPAVTEMIKPEPISVDSFNNLRKFTDAPIKSVGGWQIVDGSIPGMPSFLAMRKVKDANEAGGGYVKAERAGPFSDYEAAAAWARGNPSRKPAATKREATKQAAEPVTPPKTRAEKLKDRKIQNQRRTQEIIGAEEGQQITLSGDVGYASADRTYTVESIGTDGSVTVRSDSGGTTLSASELAGAKRRGVTFSRVQQKAPVAAEQRPASYGANNKLVTADRAAEVRARLKAKLNGSQLNSGIDPEIVALGTELAIYHIEAGVRRFSDFARTMMSDLDMPLDKVRPYLRGWYNSARDTIEDSDLSIDGMDSPDQVRAELKRLTDGGETAEGKTETVTTPAGREFEVRHKVIEADQLITSNNASGGVNPDYPQELQPRDRSRAASQDQINDIASRLNPRLLGESASATDGAPIVAPDGVVESGNGRTLAIRQAYARGQADTYRQWLAEQGHNVDGMTAPMLVRERITPMSMADRVAYTTEANERTTLELSSTERAVSDAKKVGPILHLHRGGDLASAANRPFVSAFVGDVASRSDRGSILDGDGMLSQAGKRRMEAALLAKAYGDETLITDLFESADNDIKSIGGALLDVSGDWARMRENAEQGAISGTVDLTPNLMEAANLVRRGRAEGKTMMEMVNQDDMFSGGLDPVTRGFMSLFYRGENLVRARSRDKVAEGLRYYTGQAAMAQPGDNLFGEPAISGDEILRATNERVQREEQQAGQQQDILGGQAATGERAGQAGGERQRPQPETAGQDPAQGGLNVPGADERVEQPGPVAEAGEPVVPAADGDAREADAQGAGRASEGADQEQGAGRGNQRVPGDRAAAGGERGNQRVHRDDGQFEPAGRSAGDPERGGSRVDSIQGQIVEQQREAAVVEDADAPGASDLDQRLAAQRKAKNAPTKWGDKKSIDAALPLLLPEQRDDVLKAETRLAGHNGILYTNGTGTGKTATGLGIAKRYANDGKDNILVVVPSDKIASDWVKFAGMMAMDVKQLSDTQDNGGSGPTITTYANFAQNRSLAQRDWDMVITDESHYLSSNENGDKTGALEQLRALTGHHDGFYSWVRNRYPDEWDAFAKAMKDVADVRGNADYSVEHYQALEAKEAKARAKWQPIEQRERAKWDDRWAKQRGLPKTVMLSATPFAYAKNTDYAEGYLFDYVPPADLKKSEGQSRGYNSGSPRDQFMMQHFGYRMRTGKLTAPEAGVNSQLMEQQFNEWLKGTGALSGRRLEVPHDYDRKFVMVEDAVGTKIDEGLRFLREAEDGRYRPVYDAVMGQFDYQRRMYLLESMKARAAIPLIKDHLSLGRKIVVFHDYNQGGGFDPFRDAIGSITDSDVKTLARSVLSQPMFKINFSGLLSPIDALGKAFPNALFFNGTVSKGQRRQNADLFNDDDSGRDLIVVQSDAGREGVSLHDTTGKHQRVEFNLGMPVKPVAATQIEGRIYRTGQASDAVFRYLTTGTAWEASAFASKIAERASTAENLALGSDARGLKDAFIDAYQNADDFRASPNDGKGGKEYDRALSAAQNVSPFERSKTFYWAQQKNRKRRDQREGQDYYATPEPVGFKMVEWANIQAGDKALEPSAGHGAIARFFPAQADVTMVEPSYDLSQRAALANGNARIVNDAFEQLHINNKFDAIVMNPPYGSGGKTSTEHLAKAAQHLREGGRIVALLPKGGLADKRLDAWLNGAEDRAVKPIAVDFGGHQAIYRGDTVTAVSWDGETFTGAVTSRADDRLYIRKAGATESTSVKASQIKKIEPTGKRSEEVSPSKGLYLVARISMPSVTFERAGTSVSTQILVLEKHSNEADAADILASNLDLSNAETINELFDRLEHIDLPDRKPTSQPEPREEIVEHTTQKGKVLRGVVRTGITKEQAKEIDPYTFSKKTETGERGWFIRAKHVDDAPRYSVRDGVVQAEFGPVIEAADTADAIAKLMEAQAGEAVINRDGIGDISLIYGNNSFGLQHISNRRGEAMLERLPELIENGTVYTREGQTDRIFIGNARDEAVVRLTWNGEAKTWLVSAYERYPDLKPSAAPQESRRSQVVEDRSASMSANEVRQAVTRGPFGGIVDKMVEKGLIVIHGNANSLPKDAGRGKRGVQAVTTADNVVHLVASNLTPQNANAVLLHEMFHSGVESLVGSKRWSELQGRLASLYRQSEQSSGKAREIFDRARQRVADAKAQGAVARRMEVEEFGAYAIEEYESMPRAIRKWVDDLIGAIKAWMFSRYGKQLGDVTPAQLRALAKDALLVIGLKRRGELFGPIAERFSSTDVTNTPAFREWFGNSKVADADGKPLVVYHGTASDFSQFDTARLGDNTRAESGELGFFFTAKNFLSDSYAEIAARGGWGGKTQGGNPVVYPVYLSIKNPKQYETASEFYRDADAYKGRLNEWRAELEAQGFDGVIVRDDFEEVIAFRPEQIKSAIGNDGSFDPANPDIRYSVKPSKHFKDLTDQQKEFLDKIGPTRLPQRLRDRMDQLTENLALRVRQAGVDRYAALLRNDQALLGEDTLEGSIASSAWVLARMSHSAGGAVSALMGNGRIYLDPKDKIIDVREGTQGLATTLRELGSPQEIDRFMGWIAANRSNRLAAEGRENLFTKDQIVAGMKLSGGKLENGKSRSILYAKAWKEFQQHRDDVLGIAEDTGIITPEQRETWSEEFYVPFYRVMDEDTVGGPSSSSGITKQQAYKKLKGGKQNLNDLLENTLLNFHHLIQASMKNQAAVQAMENAEALEIAEKTTEGKRDKKLSTYVMEGGVKQWYNINDPLTFKAVSALSNAGLNNPMMKAGRAFKRFFTNMTTITPQFVIANSLRDTLSAMATSPTSAVPFKTAMKGALTYGNDRNRARMMASGGAFSFGHVYGQNADEVKASLTRSMRGAKVLTDPKMIPGTLLAGWRKWNQVTDFAENVNRAGIWERNLERGKLKAAFEARDLMDFSAHGDATIMRIMIDLVPFLNARIQGLDKLYRSGFKPGGKTLIGKGTKADQKAFARFAAVVGALTTMSVLLYLRNHDDEEYRKLEDWQRDSYWFIRFGDNAFFIPKPFEVGAIATMGERLAEQFADPTVGGDKFAKRVGHMLTDTFAFNPIPQMIKPLYELGANEDTFTGRPIEDQSMARLSPSLRSRPETSRLSDAASRGMERVAGLAGNEDLALSPVQIDHLIKAYTGAVGATAVATADTLWRRAMGEDLPARRWSEYQPIRRFYRDLNIEPSYTRYGTDFYEALKRSDRAYANLTHLQKYGDEKRAIEVEQRSQDDLGMRRSLESVRRDLSQISAEMKRVQMDKEMSGEAKRIELDRLRSQRNMINEQVGKDLEQERIRRRADGK